MKNEYLGLLFFIILVFLLSIVLFFLSYFLVSRQLDLEKISSYECGFMPFEENIRGKFDVRFYLVSILFIIFDVEVTYLFPWSICFYFLDFIGFFVMLIFLLILTLGFVYEWRLGALDW